MIRVLKGQGRIDLLCMIAAAAKHLSADVDQLSIVQDLRC